MSAQMKRRRTLLIGSAVMLTFVPRVVAQEHAGEALPKLVEANERFGRKLLAEVHGPVPSRNMVVSPLSITVMMAAMQTSSSGGGLREQGNALFGWGLYPDLKVASRMLLAAFEKPIPVPIRPRMASRPPTYLPQGAWITNTLLYRSVQGSSPVDARFREQAENVFHIKLVNTGSARPKPSAVAALRKGETPLPKVTSKADALIVSGTHLRTKWQGNSFSMSVPAPLTFHAPLGDKVVPMLTSELSGYLYVERENYEAVVLPADEAYMIAVLPKRTSSLTEVEKDLAEHPEFLDSTMKRQLGKVTMPPFHIRVESDLRPPLEGLGVKAIFEDLPGIFTIPNTHIRSFTQRLDIEVNKDGIRADAETVAGVVYGGVVVGREPFHLVLDRPFMFLVRDWNTNSLLFLGAVVDPTQN
jgi:serpin B